MIGTNEARGQIILVLAPHTDDAELGCGAFIAHQLDRGAEVHVVALSTAQQSLPDGRCENTLELEFHQSMEVLGVPARNRRVINFPVRKFPEHRQEILETFVALRKELNPTLVLVPSSTDTHQDHEVVSREGMRAFKEVSVFGYELPWNQLSTNLRVFAPLEKKYVQQKWEALSCYSSQLELNRGYFDTEMIFGLAKLRGIQINAEWAEAFEALRVRI